MTPIEIEKELAVHDEALFGLWTSASHREHGVVEKTNSVLHRLPRIEKMMQGMMFLMVVPLLNAMGLPTQSLVPFIFKTFIHALGA